MATDIITKRRAEEGEVEVEAEGDELSHGSFTITTEFYVYLAPPSELLKMAKFRSQGTM